MKRKRYSEEQIIGILKEHEAGLSLAEIVRKHGISEQSFYRWRSKFGGMQVSDANGCGSSSRRTRGLRSCSPIRCSTKQRLRMY